MTPFEFDPEAIRSLATILRDTGLTEIELVAGENRVRLTRAAAVAASPAPVPAAPAQVAAPAPPSAPAPAPAAEESPLEGTVPSPMVGIVYLAPDPGSPPFVTLGQPVTAGQTLLMIEAMKTFNQIKAPRAGILTRMLVANGQPVEYGQSLLVIE